MTSQRAERFTALDEQLEDAVRDARTTGTRRATTVKVGNADPVDLPIESLKTLHKVVHALAAGSEPILTTTEAADFLDVSRPYVTRLLKSGKLPYVKKGNRHLVPAAALQEFKARRSQQLEGLAAMAAAEEELGVR
ncbi:MAG: helix-turn-helix domain-containing protein [Nitriliruptorales bacterium]|nr:helix-turn-helix domain-containing protein [Nitriliruptorales bacterium]